MTLHGGHEQVTRDLRRLLESTQEGIIALDVDGVCTLVNRSATELLGDPAATLRTKNVHKAIHPHCRECGITRVLAGGAAERVHDDAFVRIDGSIVPVQFAVGPVIDDNVMTGAVVTFTDITERIKLEAQLEQAVRMNSLGRLAATVAHEFNNVLMGISPFVEILKRPATVGEKRTAALDHIGKAMERGKRITSEILRYTRPAAPVIEEVAVEEWIGKFEKEMRSLLGPAYDLRVVVGESGLAMLGDARQLHQIMSNLLLNARDAMPDGGPLTITFTAEPPDAQFEFGVVAHPEAFVHIAVEDRGSGIAPDVLRHIFEPLFTTKRNGTGLGLAVAHQVVKQHGGEIFAQSTVGEGSRFHIFLARAAARQTSIPPPLSEPEAGDALRRILLVEDDENVATGIAALLQDEGIEVNVVSLGAEVLDAIQQTEPDAIILDIGLPDMDGTEVYVAVAERYPGMPVIFSTGHGDERKIGSYLSRQNVAMLIKPYEIPTLLQTLRRLRSERLPPTVVPG